MSTSGLTKPVFSKVNDIQAGKHCYNVYCRVVEVNYSTTTRPSGDVLKICEGIVADESGSANFKFEGDNVALITKGATIAIRNGRSDVIQEHIKLGVDKFGRVTPEDAKLVPSTNTEKNISSIAYTLSKAAGERSRGPRGGDRAERSERGDRGRNAGGQRRDRDRSRDRR